MRSLLRHITAPLPASPTDESTGFTMQPVTLASSASDPLIRHAVEADNEQRVDLRSEIKPQKDRWRTLYLKLGASFFLFGLVNNVLYVIILSAALDLVPATTPKGIILFFNIAPSLSAKVAWPYILRGHVRYAKRLIGCCLFSGFGMLLVALFDNLYSRLLGIALASFSSGLGELTFLQLSTTYSPASVGGHGISYFASGTGAAGLVGALMWWELRGLGVRFGVGISSALPIIIPLTYFLFLPDSSAFMYDLATPYEDIDSPCLGTTTLPYTPLENEDEDGEEEDALFSLPKYATSLTMGDKLSIVRPLLLKYMLPLFCVYLLEYTINQGIAPTLLYSVPKSSFLGNIIHSVRDFYPLWQLVYQTAVFLSRSSISFGLPALPVHLFPLPAVFQAAIVLVLVFESAVGFFPEVDGTANILLVFAMISIEGICGGLAYVNIFYRINQEPADPSASAASGSSYNIERMRQEREFRMGSVGFSDTSGILLASLVSIPTEMALCRAQVRRGKLLCQGM